MWGGDTGLDQIMQGLECHGQSWNFALQVGKCHEKVFEKGTERSDLCLDPTLAAMWTQLSARFEAESPVTRVLK